MMSPEYGDKITELEKGLLQVTAQLGTLISVTAKLESSASIMSDAIQMLARKEVTVEHHTVALDKLDERVTKNEKDIVAINTSIYQACDVKTAELAKVEKGMVSKIDNGIEKSDSKTTKKIIGILSIITFVFSYIYLDMNDIKNKQVVRDGIMSDKLDKILVGQSESKEQTSINTLAISHTQSMLQDIKNHKHFRRQ